MKKLMIVAAIVCAAAFVQAGTVTWGSGVLNTASGKTGGWSETAVADASALVTMNLFLVTDAETWSSVSTMTATEMYNWSKGQTATISKTNFNGEDYVSALSAPKTATPAQVATYNGIVVVSYNDAAYGEMFMAVAAPITTNGTGSGQKQNIFGGTTGIRSWTAAGNVPEPTSGLLLLLGVAGLALRRRRA